MRLAFYAVLLLSFINCQAQPSFPPPQGLYCSCGPTTGQGNGSVNPAVAAKPFVEGILVRAGWDVIEPTDNSYNWALLDTQINRARQYGKKISLGIGSGIHIPQWVFNAGAQRVVSSMPIADTIAVPWDRVYLNKWKEFINELGNRYKNDTIIRMVYITHSTANGFEMQLPRTTTPTLSAIGYTDNKMSDSWKEVIDAFNNAFPNHYLSNDFHPVNNSDAVADTVYQYAVSTIGQRYGAAAWWWTQKNTTVYPAQYSIMKNSVANNTFSAVQFAGNGSKDSARFGAGGMPVALQLGIDDKICYWEVWNDDLLNPQFDSLFTAAACTPLNIEEQDEIITKIYPNPTDGICTIELPDTQTKILITDMSGRVIFRTEQQHKKLIVDLSSVPAGVYLLQLNSAYSNTFHKLVIQ